MKYIKSPNFDTPHKNKRKIKYIIVHYTGMQSMRESINRLCNKKSSVSSHYLIGRSGKILQMVKESNIAWHAGKSCWSNRVNLNKTSIGIELQNKGHNWGYQKFTKKQLNSLIFLIKKLKKKYKIKNHNFIGHSDCAPSRKIDPGEKFPWDLLANKSIGIWHSLKRKDLILMRKKKINLKNTNKKFYGYLKKIGYCLKKQKNYKLVKAFQSRFRNEIVDGIIDQESFEIANNLSKIKK